MRAVWERLRIMQGMLLQSRDVAAYQGNPHLSAKFISRIPLS